MIIKYWLMSYTKYLHTTIFDYFFIKLQMIGINNKYNFWYLSFASNIF